MPTLARSATSTPPTASGATRAAATRSATSSASAGSATSSSRNANSSPPSRATVSPGPDRRAQPLADLLEHPVARGVPEAVVDRLEVVEVHEQDDDAPVLPASPLQGVRDAVGEQRAVREAGERVVEGLARQLGLEHLALGDVAVVDDDAADGGVVEQVAADRLHRPPRAVGVLDAALEATLGALARGEVRERLLHRAAIVVVDQRGELPALPVGRGVAEDPFQGDALEADRGRRRRGSPGRPTSSGAGIGTWPRGRAGRRPAPPAGRSGSRASATSR